MIKDTNGNLDEGLEGRVCPFCGNEDYDDAFLMMKCGNCNNMYWADEAKSIIIHETDGIKK